MLRSRLAFTLVALLVLIAIIAILISLLLPALVKARQRTDWIVCQNNLRRIGMALNMYTDQCGYYSGAWASLPGQAGAASIWPSRLRAFTGTQRVFYCPSRPTLFEWREESVALPPEIPAPTGLIGFGYKLGEPLLMGRNSYLKTGHRFSYGYNHAGAAYLAGALLIVAWAPVLAGRNPIQMELELR